jgi:peptide-methionine (S)-S-oxide reductase
MSPRSLAASLAIAAALGLAGAASAQDKAGAPKSSSPRNGAAAGDEKAATPKDKDKDDDKGKGKDDDKTENPKDKDKDKADAKGDEAKPKLERATFGGGCFWCLEAIFERIPGVKTVVSGYAGGNVPKPSYELVSSGLTGHAEVVQMIYDPEVVSYEKLLDVFWACHDPTTLNRQGPDFGTQYRSIILYHNEDQRKAALKSYRQLTDAGVFDDPIVTQLVPLRAFYPADRHHQDYYRKNRNSFYCQMEIAPKLRKLKLAK